jgi:hypothetical protein
MRQPFFYYNNRACNWSCQHSLKYHINEKRFQKASRRLNERNAQLMIFKKFTLMHLKNKKAAIKRREMLKNSSTNLLRKITGSNALYCIQLSFAQKILIHLLQQSSKVSYYIQEVIKAVSRK